VLPGKKLAPDFKVVSTQLKSEASPLECGLEVFCAIDQKDGGSDVVFVSEFTEENIGEGGRSR
jgi:hypothetical protein